MSKSVQELRQLGSFAFFAQNEVNAYRDDFMSVIASPKVLNGF